MPQEEARRAERDGSNPELFSRQPHPLSSPGVHPKIIFRIPPGMRLRLCTLHMTSRLLLCLPVAVCGLFGASLCAQAQAPATPAASPAAPAPAAPAAFKTDSERIGYAIGASVGTNLKSDMGKLKENGVDVNFESLLAAIKDSLAGTPLKMSDAELQSTLSTLQSRFQKQQADKEKAISDVNKKEGEAFLAANKSKEGVKTTASGLQYKLIKDGTGAMPKATDTVSVRYSGRLVNGKEFDSSEKGNAGKPVTFPLNRVIPGWTEAIQLMKVGSKYQFVIPANLAYGDRAVGADIGPGSTLVFDVELVGIESAAKEGAAKK